MGVDVPALLAAMGWRRPFRAALNGRLVCYPVPKLADEQGPTEVGVCLGTTPAEAEDAFHRCLAQVPGLETGGEEAGVGDESRYASLDETHVAVLMRRGNAVFSLTWQGSKDNALALAGKLDDLLVQGGEFCPKGSQVPVPQVELVAPRRVLLGRDVRVKYETKKTMLIRTPYQSTLHLRGEFSSRPTKMGSHTIRLVCASQRNVVFEVTAAVEVVAADALVAAANVESWEWKGRKLYFVQDPTQQWSAVPEKEREWLDLQRNTFVQLPDEDRWTRRALDDLSGIVQDQWMPSESLVHVYQDDARPARHKVYYAAFRTRGAGVVLMGMVGKQVLIYVEQPCPLPEGQPVLKTEEVLLADRLRPQTNAAGETSYPGLRVASRVFRRYRSLQPNGPYEQVQVLLIDVRLPEETNLHFPGYR